MPSIHRLSDRARSACHVVIVNYNAGAALLNSVSSSLESEGVSHVWVVDNCSTDGSLDLLREAFAGASRLHILENRTNLGFARACNRAIRALRTQGGGHVLLLNPDCEVERGAVKALLAALDTHPQAGVVGPLLLNPDGTEQAGGRRSVPTPWRTFVRAFGFTRFSNRYPRLFSDFLLHREPLPEDSVPVEAISGACMLVRKEALDQVGSLDPRYFMHCEDLDWCMRFRRADWQILFVPHASVFHHKGLCSRARPVFVEWHKHRGMMRFYRKFFRHQYPGAMMWLVTSGVWLRFAALFAVHGVRRFQARRIDSDQPGSTKRMLSVYSNFIPKSNRETAGYSPVCKPEQTSTSRKTAGIH